MVEESNSKLCEWHPLHGDVKIFGPSEWYPLCGELISTIKESLTFSGILWERPYLRTSMKKCKSDILSHHLSNHMSKYKVREKWMSGIFSLFSQTLYLSLSSITHITNKRYHPTPLSKLRREYSTYNCQTIFIHSYSAKGVLIVTVTCLLY